jgi:molecular chaperone Hsp33
VLFARSTRLCQEIVALQRAQGAAATLLARALTASALLAALQKEKTRINLQLECEGPLHGLFCDAGSDGTVRGYVKASALAAEGPPGPFQFRAALGNGGYLSVLRERGQGEHYRSSVELAHFDLAKDLELFFAQSEQLPSRVLFAVETTGNALTRVEGALVQPLPGGDPEALQGVAEALAQGLGAQARRSTPARASLEGLLAPFAPFELLAETPLVFQCRCSRPRILNALAALGADELKDMLEKEGQAVITCEFCAQRYVIDKAELSALAIALASSHKGN